MRPAVKIDLEAHARAAIRAKLWIAQQSLEGLLPTEAMRDLRKVIAKEIKLLER